MNAGRDNCVMIDPPELKAPDPFLQPTAFLYYLYCIAVQRALPRYNTAAFLPPAPSAASGGRTLVLGAGETTVTLRPQPPGATRGRGGRAGEFCLGLTQALQEQAKVYALAADTDGIDGVEDNAGARADPSTLSRARALGMNIDDYLDRNDAYSYFAGLGDLVSTGPTFTNVNDFRAVLVL